MIDRSEIVDGEHHPAADSAYRWLKGYMVTNASDYAIFRTSIELAAADGNRQAEICLGTMNRLRDSQGVSDRYLLGLVWTMLHIRNYEDFEKVAAARLDTANPRTKREFKP